MKVRTFASGLLAVLLALPAVAGILDGSWHASVDSPGGAVELVFDFRSEGTGLAGTVSIAGAGSLPITEGEVTGSEVRFVLSMDAGGAPLVIRYMGKVTGDRLDLVSVFDAGPGGPLETRLAAIRIK